MTSLMVAFRENKEEMISLTRLPTITNVEESWNQMKDTIHKATSATLGVTKPEKRYINRDTWLWNDDVEMKVREKKRRSKDLIKAIRPESARGLI